MTGAVGWVKMLVCRSGAAFLLAFALLLGGCSRPGDPTAATRQFFAYLEAGDISRAYSESAFGFQAQQTETAFTHNVNELGLTQPHTLELQAPEMTDGEAHVTAEVVLPNEVKRTFIVTLVQDRGDWRVHALRSPRGPGQRPENRFTLVGKGASFSSAQSKPLPSDAEILKLAQTTMENFDEAVQQKSFEKFYSTVATAWQKQLSVSQLERAFAPFMKTEVRIGGLRQAEMQLDGPPTINPEGILIVNGHFNTAPYQIYFAMKFINEQPWWKLFGLDVHLQK